MSEEYLKVPDSFGGTLAGKLLETIERAKVTEETHVVVVIVGCPDSQQIGTVAIPKPNPLNRQAEEIEAEFINKMFLEHVAKCPNRDPEHNVNGIPRRINPERKLNAVSEASSLAILFKEMLEGGEKSK